MIASAKAAKGIDWAVASRPVAGQTVSGDLHVVQFFGDCVLLAVIDGIGHGSEADKAAHAAGAVLEKNISESTITLMRLCHEALAHTRGAVMTIACLNFKENTMNWVGVGNVEARLFRADPNVTPADYTAAARMFQADYAVEEMRGGHFMHREYPDDFAAKLLVHL